MSLENAIKNYEDVDSWKTIMFLYTSALKEVGTKLEILNDEFQHVHQYNPIEHIKTRVKTPESIVKKLRKNGYEISIENMVKNDKVFCEIAGNNQGQAGGCREKQPGANADGGGEDPPDICFCQGQEDKA